MHPNTKKFHDLLDELKQLHDKKQADYGTDDDPFANVRASEAFGIDAWLGCMIRANDKMKRLQTYALKGELSNEAVEDSFMDLAVYSVIALILFSETTSNDEPTEKELDFDKLEGIEFNGVAYEVPRPKGSEKWWR